MRISTRSLLPFSLLVTLPMHAQNWEVGVPLDVTLSHLFMFGSGCTPGSDENFTFPSSPVTGVDYIAVVTQIDQPGTVNVLPGPVDPLELGDTIWITTPVLRHMYFTTGSGSVDLDFKAIGTPTVVGEAHPCAQNDLWMSDLGICPENLSILIENSCTTEDPTGINEGVASALWFTAPSMANSYRLLLQDVIANSAMLFDAQGRMVHAPLTFAKSRGSLDVSALPDGIYVVRATTLVGATVARSFALVH